MTGSSYIYLTRVPALLYLGKIGTCSTEVELDLKLQPANLQMYISRSGVTLGSFHHVAS